MKLLVCFALLCFAEQVTVLDATFAERVDKAYRQKVDNVAMTQQMKAKQSKFDENVKSGYASELDTLRKGAMGMGTSTVYIASDNGKMMGKMMMMTTTTTTTTKVPTSSPSTIVPSVVTETPTLEISMTTTTTFNPTTTFGPTATTPLPSFSPTETTEQPTIASTEFETFEPTLTTALPTSQGSITPTTRNGMMMMKGKMNKNGKGMMMGKGNKGMDMGKMKGMKMGKAEKTDAPSASPVPTSVPRPSAPVPVMSLPVNPDCAPTVGDCLSNIGDLINTFAQLDDDDVVSLCGGVTFFTLNTLVIEASRATLCCASSDCRLENVGSDSIISVVGDSVTIVGLTFLNGISDTNGGNVAIFGDGSNIVINSTFINGTANGRGGNLFIESTGSVRIQNSTFVNGTAALNGGGVSIERASAVTIIGCTFTENAAIEAGALYSTRVDTSAEGQVILIDETLFDANAADIGGALAVANLGQNAVLMIINSAFVDNFANTTAGIGAIIEFLDNLDLTLEGNIASGNDGGSDPSTMCDGFLTVPDVNAAGPLCIQGNDDFP